MSFPWVGGKQQKTEMPKLAGLWNKCREDNGFRLSDWLCHSPQCLCFIVSGFYVQPEQIIPGLISNSDLMYYRLWSINGLWTGNWLRARLGKALHGVFWKRGCIGWSKFLFLILYPTHGNSQEDLPHGLRRGDFAQRPWKGWSPWERERSRTPIMLWGPQFWKWGRQTRGTRILMRTGVPLDYLTPSNKCSVVSLPA